MHISLELVVGLVTTIVEERKAIKYNSSFVSVHLRAHKFSFSQNTHKNQREDSEPKNGKLSNAYSD